MSDDDEPLVLFPYGSSVRSGTARVGGAERYVVSVRFFMGDGSQVVAFLDPMHALEVSKQLARRAGVETIAAPR